MKPKERLRSAVDRACVKVPKKIGETTRQLLTTRNILDASLRVRRKGESLLFPLVRDLDQLELETLKEVLDEDFFFGHEMFQPRVRPSQTLEDAVSSQVPGGLLEDLPRSYDIIGDIAVVELRPDLTRYEAILGEGILKIKRNVRVVLAKAGEIFGKDRIRPVRYLAGEHRTWTIHRESGCRFKVDIARAYFSPRLSHEHERIVQMVQPGEYVTDMFAGVGPFSIMISKKVERVQVNAIDANPDAVKLLEENAKLNKLTGNLKVWLGDASTVVEQHLEGKASRVIMNHPSEAKDFVETACKALQKDGGIVHYYTFADGLNWEDKAVNEFEGAMERTSFGMKKMMAARRVRGVAPMKWQVVVDALVAPN